MQKLRWNIDRTVLAHISVAMLFVGAILPDNIQIKFIGLSLVFGFLSIKKTTIPNTRQTAYLISYFLLFLIFVISALLSQNIKLAFDIVVTRVAFLLIPMLAILNVYSSIKLSNVLELLVSLSGIVIIGCLVFVGYSLLFDPVFKINFLQSPIFYLQEVLNNYKHRTYLNSFLLITMVLGFTQADVENKGKLYLYAFNILISIFILLSGSRAGFLSLAVVWLIWGIIQFKTHRKFILFPGFVLVIFLTIGTLFVKSDSRFNVIHKIEGVSELNEGGRLTIWKNSLQLISSNWVYGVGLGDTKDELIQTYAKNGFLDGVQQGYNCHNQYLQLVVESGFIPAFILLFIVFYPFFLFKHWRQKWIWLSISCIISLNLFFEVYLNRIAGVVILSFLPLFYVLLVAQQPVEISEDKRPRYRLKVLRLVVSIILSASLLLAIIVTATTHTYQLDADNPETFGTHSYTLVDSLPGNLPTSFNENTKGYQLNKLATPTLGNGYAYAYTKMGNSNVEDGDSLQISVWFYANESFNADFVGISYGGSSSLIKPFTQLKHYPHNEWQIIQMNVKCRNGKAPAYFYFAKMGSNFEGLNGNVIFARPVYKIVRK